MLGTKIHNKRKYFNESYIKGKMINKLKIVIAAIATLATSITTITANEIVSYSPLSENAKICLLTSGPSDMAIFTVWGHTAIRVQDPETGIDQVFNYGIFSFGDPLSFVARFVSGQTDYKLGKTSMMHSIDETIEKNADYYEQELNLTQKEKERLYGALLENYKPENRVYRYKYFTDNCATRPRKLIKKCVDGSLVYGPFTNKQIEENYQATLNKRFKKADGTNKTYRDIIAELLPTSPWYKFGIDLCLGQPTDKKFKEWDQVFLPIYLKDEVSYQSIKTGDSIRPLIKETHQLLSKEPEESKTEWTNVINPLVAFWTLFLLTLLHVLYYYATGKDDRWVYLLFFGALGLLGTIVFYVSCISDHEFVSPNLNLLWLSPIQLIISILVYIKRAQKIEYACMCLSLVGYICSIIYFIICKSTGDALGEIQQYNSANLPLILMEALMTVAWLVRYKNKAIKAEKA